MAKTIITLGREYCTGGRYIAKDVARALGIKLYDKELITMAAKNSGLSEEAVAASEKRHTHSLLYSLYTMGNDLPLGDQVFILQSRIIKQLADEGPCVIVGRCGDYVLRDRKDVLRIFVYAPKEWRLAYGKENNMLQAKDEKGIKDEIDKTDRNRAAYYNYYTQNRWGDAHNYDLAINAALGHEGEDILPEEVAYVMEDKTTGSTSNGAFAAAAAGCCGFPCWQAWMDLQDLREQIHDGCSVAVRIERRIRGQRDPIGVWMGLRGFGHDDAVLADYVLLNDPTADSDGAVNCTMAVTDFARYFTGRAIALRPKPRDTEANRPRRVSCDFVYSAEDDCWYLAQKGQRQLLPAEFSGWAACSPHDGIAHATTAHRTFRRMERTRTGGFRFPPEQTAAGGRCSVYIVDHTGTMQFAEVRLPAPPPPALPLLEANQSTEPSVS
jgi:hypothetical protein